MIAVIDYDAGNLTSVDLALRHLGFQGVVTGAPAQVRRAERIIFPGVGSAASCMRNLAARGLDVALREAVEGGKPVLAICIGMQLLFEYSDEDGGVPCLGLFAGSVRRFSFPAERRVKVPHMGWNGMERVRSHPLFANIDPAAEFYFVHSYHAVPVREEDVLGMTDYGGKRFCSAVARDNLFATQFHPEKSGEAGLELLRNFLRRK